MARVDGNSASTCCAAGSTTMIFTCSAGMSALPRLLTAALRAIGSPKGTGLGVALKVPVRPLPVAALESTVKLVLLVASTAPSASRTLKAGWKHGEGLQGLRRFGAALKRCGDRG